MSLRNLILARNFSIARVLARPALSEAYKSEDLWDERFRCRFLSDNEAGIKALNAKIIVNEKLNNIELDIFVNISNARTDDVAQLQETARSLREFRKSIYAHTLLPSTHHATCRLFVSSERTSSLANILDDRVQYGIFADFYSLNLSIDAALDKEDYITAARIASQLMYQEEFGMNPLTDMLALYSISKYVESKPDFEEWITRVEKEDLVLTGKPDDDFAAMEKSQEEALKKEAKAKKEVDEDAEEDEDDAEYIRVPWLRNPYNDHHFDLKHPRAICGKSLVMLGNTYIHKDNSEFGLKCKALGQVLLGKWEDLVSTLEQCSKSKVTLGQVGQMVEFYMTELHTIEAPKDGLKGKIQAKLKKLTTDGPHLSDIAEANFDEVRPKQEQKDTEELRAKLLKWSELRDMVVKYAEDRAYKEKLAAEIKAKKEELKQKEQYIYFYDNLQKSRVTRIAYE